MSSATVCNCHHNTPEPEGLWAMSSRQSGQQQKTPDCRTYWAGSVVRRVGDYWPNADGGGKWRQKLVNSGPSGTEELGCAGISTTSSTVPGLTISSLPSLFDQPTTFELVGRFAGLVIALYRPGSAAVQQSFFDELAAILDRVATYQEPIYVVGDFNIRLDRPDDPHAAQFRLLVESYGLLLHDTCPTHQLGGTFDAVVSRADTAAVLDWLTSSTSACPTITCYNGRLTLLARPHILPWRTVEPGVD